ncbi:MAG: hypothetical protein Q9202_006198 [Teloschistes flavicans]
MEEKPSEDVTAERWNLTWMRSSVDRIGTDVLQDTMNGFNGFQSELPASPPNQNVVILRKDFIKTI